MNNLKALGLLKVNRFAFILFSYRVPVFAGRCGQPQIYPWVKRLLVLTGAPGFEAKKWRGS